MPESQIEITIEAHETELQAAVNAALETARLRPTGKNVGTLKKAQKELEGYRAAQLETGETVFTSISQMVDFLSGENWKIGNSTAYEHRDQGKLKLSEDGSIVESVALAYAHEHLQKKDGGKGEKDNGLQHEKLQKEINRIDFDGKLRGLKYKQALGELIEREQVEIELSSRATNLKNFLDNVARKGAGRMVKLVGGDPQKTSQLIEYLLGMNRKAFDNYSRPIDGLEDEE
jgi:hypothetical protein